MNETQMSWCVKTLDKLMSKKMARPFFNQLEEANFSLSIGKISQEPNHNLNYVKKQLENGKYATVYDFGCAINSIFADGFYNFNQDTLMYGITLTLSQWFSEKIKTYPRSEKEEWAENLKKLQSKVDNLLKDYPGCVRMAPVPEPAKKTKLKKKTVR